MSEIEQPDASKRGKMNFRKWSANKPKLSAEQARRQGDIVRLAFELLGGRDEAMAFLNETDPSLDARPLDVALASDEGYLNVEKLMRQASGNQA